MSLQNPKTDAEWQAHGDAHTLAQAKVIAGANTVK